MKLKFHLGHNSTLSQLELDSVLGKGNQIKDFNHLNHVCNRLGGLVKVTDQKGKTLWIHSAKSWYRRDRLKPYSDPKKGMLPPKLARIMVNLALGQKGPTLKDVPNPEGGGSDLFENLTLLDPFCGTGTILIEAGILGLNTIGADLDSKQLAGTKTNLNWARTKNFKLINSDATHISDKLEEKVDYIVTEPFMGAPNPRPEKIKNIVTGLKKLYLGCLKDWAKIMNPGGIIVITLPYFQSEGKTLKTSSIIDSLIALSYNVKTKDINFTRPGSAVQREIIVLEKK